MKYLGRCHCGTIRFEVDLDIKEAYSCNCSICTKRGHLLAFTTESNFKLLSGEESLSDYQFNKKIVHHLFCKNCGVGPFGQANPPGSNEPKRAINLRCLDDFDFESVPVHKIDGRSR